MLHISIYYKCLTTIFKKNFLSLRAENKTESYFQCLCYGSNTYGPSAESKFWPRAKKVSFFYKLLFFSSMIIKMNKKFFIKNWIYFFFNFGLKIRSRRPKMFYLAVHSRFLTILLSDTFITFFDKYFFFKNTNFFLAYKKN